MGSPLETIAYFVVGDGKEIRFEGGVFPENFVVLPYFKKDRLNQFFRFNNRFQIFKGKAIQLPGIFGINQIKSFNITLLKLYNQFNILRNIFKVRYC